MSAFEMAALAGSLAGVSMVLGGIWLVAKGVITLAATPQADALSLEWKKQFRINTQVPGLAFFLVGLLFMAVSLFFLKPPDVRPIEFDGQVSGVDEPLNIVVRPAPWELPASTDGQFSGKVYPDFSFVVLAVSAPGYEPFTRSVKIGTNGTIRVGTLTLRRRLVQADLKKKVSPLPFPSPSTANANSPAFGVAQ
jgi:hypothetical protein